MREKDRNPSRERARESKQWGRKGVAREFERGKEREGNTLNSVTAFGAMATDQEITQALRSLFITETNPSTAVSSLNGVVQELQSKLGQDLTHKVDFIRSQLHLLFQPPQPPPQPQQPQLHDQNDHFALQQPANLLPAPSAIASSAFHSFSAAAQPSALAKAAADHDQPLETPKESNQTRPRRRGGPGGLNKLCGVSPELQAIVGHPALPRTEIVKQLWAYIRKHNLQDPSNKRKIVCNHELRVVFETDCTDMFKMNKLLAKHIIPLEPTKQSGTNKHKVDVKSGIKTAEPGPTVIISETLASFFGVGGREMLQSEVLRRIWEYIKIKNLEDPLNRMVILCDAKLQDLFGCESISALGIPEILTRHILRR